MRVLVTDADLKLALGAVRSIARHGGEVVAAARSPRAHSFHSRYVRERLVSPPVDDEERFLRFLLEAIDRLRIDVVLPIGQETLATLSRHRDDVAPRAALALPPRDAVDVALSKRRTIELARSLGVPVPETYERHSDVRAFPAVAKRVVGSGHVRYLNTARDLEGLDAEAWLVQEYVRGEGRGLFALCEEGKVRAVFMHRRIREFPVTGGASTAAESIDDPVLRELGLRLLGALGWHGVAMVEFKYDEDGGGYTLMEINPKFWGSLDLSIAAGVDFPWLAVQLALGSSTPAQRSYRVGLRHQWVFPDLLHAAAEPRHAGHVFRDLIDPRVKKDVSLRDPMPMLAEARATTAALIRSARAGRLRYPHGRPAKDGPVTRPG